MIIDDKHWLVLVEWLEYTQDEVCCFRKKFIFFQMGTVVWWQPEFTHYWCFRRVIVKILKELEICPMHTWRFVFLLKTQRTKFYDWNHRFLEKLVITIPFGNLPESSKVSLLGVKLWILWCYCLSTPSDKYSVQTASSERIFIALVT